MIKFKIRPSQCSKIMGTLKAGSITAKQAETIKTLQAKEKLTAKQEITLNDLITKRDAPPELPETAKTYCKEWLKEQLYQRRKEISSKYTIRGNMSEDNSIALIGEYIGNPLLYKNESTFENEYIIGTPDVIVGDTVIDAKSSWDFQTFPLFSDKLNVDYEWQVRCYMDLCNKKKAQVIYCLNNLPEELQRDEVRKLVYNGMSENEAIEKVREYHTYDGLPLELRVKSYSVEYDHNKINAVYRRIELCRKYIEAIAKTLT